MKIKSKKDKFVISFGDTVWESIRKNPKSLLHLGNSATRMLIYSIFLIALPLVVFCGIVSESSTRPDNYVICFAFAFYLSYAIILGWCLLGPMSAQRLSIEKNCYLSYTYIGGFSSAIRQTPLSDISIYDFQQYEERVTLVLNGKISLAKWTQSCYCIPVSERDFVLAFCDYLRACGYGDRIKAIHDVDRESKESCLRDIVNLLKG